MNSQPGNQTGDLEGYPSVERPPFVPPEATRDDYYTLAEQTLPEGSRELFYGTRDTVEQVGVLLDAMSIADYYIEQRAADKPSPEPALKQLGTVGDRFYKTAQELLINIQDAVVSPQEYAMRQMKLLGASETFQKMIDAAIAEVGTEDQDEGAKKFLEILGNLKRGVENVHKAIEGMVDLLEKLPKPKQVN